jgi:copper chaperone CopZ
MAERSRREADAGAAGTVIVSVPTMLCRRCVRVVSRRVTDVPGVVSLEVDAARRLLRVRGDVDRAALLAALESGGFGGCEMPAEAT